MQSLLVHQSSKSVKAACGCRHGARPVLLLHRCSQASTTNSCPARSWFHTPTYTFITRAAESSEPVLPENVDPNDPELQKQIDAILKELDPDFLLDDTKELLSGAAVAPPSTVLQQEDQQTAAAAAAASRSSNIYQAEAWQDGDEDEETESGLPDGVVMTRAEYKRKAAVLVEFMTALQQGEAAQEVFEQKLSAFKVEIDEALLHMLSRRIEVAKDMQQDPEEVTALQDLYDVLRLEHERAQASPAMRLLDECLDILGDDPYLPGARQRAEQVIQKLKNAFTGGAAANIDIFAAAAALAADKALAAEALMVEFVPQAVFVQEGMELLQQAKEEMQQLAAAVTDAQLEIQKARNANPELLQTPEARQHIQQVQAADAALQRRKLAVGQLAYVLDIAQDLDAAERGLASSSGEGLTGDDEQMAEELAALLGVGGRNSPGGI